MVCISRNSIPEKGGPDIADEDGCAEFQRNALFVIGEPEGCLTPHFLVGFEMQGVPVDLVHGNLQMDGGLILINWKIAPVMN